MAGAALSAFLKSALGHDAPEDISDSAALRTSLSRVGRSIATAEAEAIRIVEAEREAIAQALGCAEELRTHIEALKAGVSSVDCNSLRERLDATVFKAPVLRDRLTASRASLGLLRSLANIHQCLSKFESSMRANDLRGAAEHVAHLRGEHVAHLREHSLMRDTTLLESICSKAESCEEQLCLSLRDAWAKAALGFAREDDAVSEDSLVLDSMAGRQHQLISALNAAGLLDECIQKLGGVAITRLLRPVLHRPHIEIVASLSQDGAVTTLRVHSRSAAGESTKPLALEQKAKQACDGIEVMLRALHGFLSEASAPTAASNSADGDQAKGCTLPRCGLHSLGREFWSELRQVVIDDCLLRTLVDEMDEKTTSATLEPGTRRLKFLAAKAESLIRHMEDSLRDVTNAKASTDGPHSATNAAIGGSLTPLSSLVAAASELEVRAAAFRCDVVLSEARAILFESRVDSVELPHAESPLDLLGALKLADDPPHDAHAGDQRVGRPSGSSQDSSTDVTLSVLSFPKCRVSGRSVRLLRLLQLTLEQACSCSALGAGLLYSRARDLVDLFLSLAPTHSAEVLVPHTALILHNDAMLVRHRCLTLGIEFASRLPSPLCADEAPATFIDFAPELQSFAQGAVELVAHAAREQLLVALAAARGFVRVGEDAEAHGHASVATRQLLHELRKLHRLVSETLPLHAGMQLLAKVVETPLADLCGQVLALRHISEADSRALQMDVLAPLCTACDTVLQPAPALGRTGEDTPASTELQGVQQGEQLVPSLRTARQLAWVLGAERLRYIHERWSAKELDALPARDLLALLRSLYPHSALASDPNARRFVDALAEEAARVVRAETFLDKP